MWLDEDAPIRKRELHLEKPYVNAAGTLGFAPDPHTMPFLKHLGAFITNPISRRPRQPAKNRCCLPFPGGFLLHTGWPNPGFSRALARYQHAWASAPLPVIIHLLGETPGTVAEMVRKLEGHDNLLAVELGLPPDCDSTTLRDFMEAAQGELPTVVSLESGQAIEMLEPLVQLQPAAVHLQAPRGTLPCPDGNLISGRLYGPAIFPHTLNTLQTLNASGLQIIAGGGVFTQSQVQAMLETGAFAASLDAVLWQIDINEIF